MRPLHTARRLRARTRYRRQPRLALRTFLGADGSPSDKLVINGGTGTGATTIKVTNVGGPGAETTGNGILVVSAINGATTAPGAFVRAPGELRAGAFDYDLFHGGVGGSTPPWFLRSAIVVEPPVIPPSRRHRRIPPVIPPVVPPVTTLPPDPPPEPLPPGSVYPIIGPELATYGVVQPLARQLGLSILGTLNDRVGDTYVPDGCAIAPAAASMGLLTKAKPTPAPCPLFSPSVWGRFFGQTVDNQYHAFADPRASGNLGGFQGGIDLLRGSLIAGHSERAGLYGAFGNVSANVNGLVTNPAATGYILTHTGSLNLESGSAGGYWTHVGPGGWYLDTVLQGTWYGGSASTQFASLDTHGTGFIASLEGGVPFALPQFGSGFVLEPQRAHGGPAGAWSTARADTRAPWLVARQGDQPSLGLRRDCRLFARSRSVVKRHQGAIGQRSFDAALDRLVMASDPSCSRKKRWILPVGEKHLRPLHTARRLRARTRYRRQPRNFLVAHRQFNHLTPSGHLGAPRHVHYKRAIRQDFSGSTRHRLSSTSGFKESVV